MLSSIPRAELGINGTDHFEGKFISPLGTWEDYTIGSYLVLVCEYSFSQLNQIELWPDLTGGCGS